MDLLRNIIKSVQGRTKETLDLLERMTEGDLEIHLRDLLKEYNKNGSRVIITTRKEDVAERADDRGFVHKLRFLSQEESWDLFRRKLLDVRAMVPEMESLAKDMVEKCRGLPLAIVVLSGLLSHKKGLNQWQKVKDHLWKNIKEDKYIEISNILSFSYNDLDGQSFPSLEFINCCEKLQKLWLDGRIEELPHLFSNSITMMVLWESKLMEDPMPLLGMLPNLRNLELEEAYERKEIMCSDNSFSQLEFLHLDNLEKLERWDLGTSAMPLIKGLGIHNCPNLKEIPERMKDEELLKRNYLL
ncbi:hypothetical protein R3W88_010926 [Solanum pinnatisectum]|uniref:NB-ARC domain-containing protein n=1 Tax=Solanum pinnatisectum TaxID=50273 RepID=A0AAV9L5G6_9SOLN|nr:hypothetical protein R3W88_010926 [Solanum pinnatisectum]